MRLAKWDAIRSSRLRGTQERLAREAVAETADIGKAVRDTALSIVHDDRDLDGCAALLYALTGKENPTPSESEAIEVLTTALVAYDHVHYPDA